MGDTDRIVKKLQYFIVEGELREVQLLLDSVVEVDAVRDIEEKFLEKYPGTDPLNFAIDNREEDIALYLVEKNFTLDRKFQWPDENCDQWCYNDHGVDNCPSEYTATDNAERRNLYKVKKLIDLINSGQRKPGQSLTVIQIPNYVQKPTAKETTMRVDKAQMNVDSRGKSLAEEARDIVDSYGKTYVTKGGDTLLHLHLRKPKVYIYVFASQGVPINIQNEAGDTALHIAVREGLLDSVEALLQCSADLTVRNKMGMTATDEADSSNKPLISLINAFQPGVVSTVNKGQHRNLERLVKRTWCSLDSIVKEGKTILELAENKALTEKGTVQNCFRLLKDFRKTSQLIHAVLCEDPDETRRILKHEKGWSVNYKFRDRIGKTLLSSAIESNNLEIVMLLVEHGARIKGIRVRENERSDITVPLFQKSIHPDINPDIAKYLNSQMTDTSEHMEKDVNGNTAILRAIEEGCSAKFIHWLLLVTKGRSLTDRNKDSLTPKELAQARNREDIVKTIDKFILSKLIPTGIPQFSTHFWREKDLITITDEVSGKNLVDIVSGEDKVDVRKWLNFHDVHNYAIRLFEAVALGNEDVVKKTYDAHYQDRNGYTALIRAIVYQQLEVARFLCITYPVLKSLGDNCNRYPLHYAYSLPEYYAKIFVNLLMESNPEDIENKVDKDGRFPADYATQRNNMEIQKMLYDARTLDPYGKRGPPLGPWPQGALKRPPDENNPMEFLEVL